MKRNLAILMALPLAFAACAEDKPAPQAARRSFTADYDLGLLVEYAESESSVTRTFTQLGESDPVQVDDLKSTGYTAADEACTLHEEGRKTEVRQTITRKGKNRIAGKQHVWMLFGSYTGNSAGSSSAPDDMVNVTGRPDAGHLFITEPSLNVYLGLQATAQCDCELDQYLDVVENDIFIFEDESDVDLQKVTTVFRSAAGVTTDYTSTLFDEVDGPIASDLALSTYGRYLADGYVWQAGPLGNFYDGPVGFSASLVVPDGVGVGDTWLDEAGRLNAAVAEEPVTINGREVKALVVVTRGSTDVAPGSDGVLGWCVKAHQSEEYAYNGTTDTDTTRARLYLTDLCNTASAGVDQRGTGWINQAKTWYYKGLVVRQEVSTVDVVVGEFGFAITNDGALPSPPTVGSAVNDCARYHAGTADSVQTPTTDTTKISRYQPYAIYQVVETVRVREATNLRENYTLPVEYAEENGKEG